MWDIQGPSDLTPGGHQYTETSSPARRYGEGLRGEVNQMGWRSEGSEWVQRVFEASA